jgi:NADH-quinone oxidoreductase subunit L
LIDLPFFSVDFNKLDIWLEPVMGGVREVTASSFLQGAALSGLALLAALVGLFIGSTIYRRGLNADGSDPEQRYLGGFQKVLANAYYFNDAIAWFVRVPGTIFANFLARGVDKNTIDGAVNGIGKVTREGGVGLRRLQTGLVRNYALAIVGGTVLLLVYISFRASF